MAYTAVVTKQSVSQLTEDDFQATIHAVITDNGTSEVVLEKDYSERYYSETPISDVKTKLQSQLVADWDKLVAEKDIFDKAAFDTMVSEIQTAANTYINA